MPLSISCTAAEAGVYIQQKEKESYYYYYQELAIAIFFVLEKYKVPISLEPIPSKQFQS